MSSRVRLWFAMAVLCAMGMPAAGDDDDAKASAAGQPAVQPALNDEQQRAVGIVVARPIAGKMAPRIAATGLVLDPTALIGDLGEMTSSSRAQLAAAAELKRLDGLYKGGAGASVKMIEAAGADEAKANAQAQSAAARFALRWAPVAKLGEPARQKLLQAALSGQSLLVRVDIPGRHSMGELPDKALLQVDGIQVPGRILGPLREAAETQSAGLLIEVRNAPLGLGPGARLAVELLTAEHAGLLLPRGALLYDESGAYVYKKLVKNAGEKMARYAAVKVTLLAQAGDGWLVTGVDDDDEVVVHGAGVLWSLQGVGSLAVDDDD